MNIVTSLYQANRNASSSDYLEIYYNANYQMLVRTVGYIPLMAPICFFLNMAATFLWNYNDLFIILVSLALAGRFSMFYKSLQEKVGDRNGEQGVGVVTPAPALGEAYWRSARRTFNSLSRLTKVADDALSIQLLVSFANNLYFVCMQLMRGFGENNNWYDNVYLMGSFAFLVGRTMAVSLVAASVREQSRRVKDVLYGVATEDYGQEVYRFLLQATSDEVALTGCSMFNVTRSLLLTVAGTILTYEVVLVQIK